MLKKKIVLCADDYSFSRGISLSIVELIKKKRLSATSCMVNSINWPTHATWLKPYLNTIDVGLHFALTDVQPNTLNLFHHPRIILQAYTHRLKQISIEKELIDQIEKFKEALGIFPHFIDGHQYIHQLPVIRDAIIAVKEKLKISFYVRLAIPKLNSIKSILIFLTGALGLKRKLKQQGINFNNSFSGIYNFSKSMNYPTYFQNFLRTIKENGLIVCHPGLSEENTEDAILLSRQDEFHYLSSDQFLEDCRQYSVVLAKFFF